LNDFCAPCFAILVLDLIDVSLVRTAFKVGNERLLNDFVLNILQCQSVSLVCVVLIVNMAVVILNISDKSLDMSDDTRTFSSIDEVQKIDESLNGIVANGRLFLEATLNQGF
jgi:hypothetical protein